MLSARGMPTVPRGPHQGLSTLAVKEQLVFLFEEVGGLGLLLFVAGTLLAAVTGNEAPTAAKNR